MTGTVKDIIDAKRRAGETAFLWLTHSSVAALYDKEEDSYESGIPVRQWELDPIEREQLIETGLVDGMGVLGSTGEDAYETVERICLQMLEENSPTDPTLFDRMTNQLAAAGVEIDQAATARARTESPNVIAVFKGGENPAELDYIEVLEGEATIWGYSGEVQAELLSVKQIQHYYEDTPITAADLAGLRYIEKDGQRFYDEADLIPISKRKTEEKTARMEAARNLALVLPDAFLKLCDEVGETPATILEGFIADLCGLEGGEREEGYITNGSDERDMAEAYFDRCGYRWRAEEKREREKV